MLSEDFAYFSKEVPSVMMLIGAGQWAAGEPFPHHHPKFDFVEEAMSLAVAALIESLPTLCRVEN